MKIFLFALIFISLPLFSFAGAPVSAGGGNISGGGGNISGGGGNISGGGDTSSGGLAPERVSYQQFHRDLVGVSKLLDRGFTGKNRSIVILDSGISPQSLAIRNLVYFHDFVGGCTLENPCDENSHGTAVADLIHQIAPSANLIVFRALDAEASGDSDNIVKTLKWARKNKEKYNIKVINMSLDSGPPSTSGWNEADVLREEIKATVEAGIHVVVGSGNSSEEFIQTFTATSPEALSVGSFSHHFNYNSDNFTKSTFTNFGIVEVAEAKHTHIPLFYESVEKIHRLAIAKPDILAPGDHILAQIVPGTHTFKKFQLLQKIVDEKEFPQALKYAQQFISLSGMKLDPFKKIIADMEWGQKLLNSRSLEQLKKNFCDDYNYYLTEHEQRYYAFISGTSFATAFVSGGIAVFDEAMPGLNPEQLRQALVDSSEQIKGSDSSVREGSYKVGYSLNNKESRVIGRVNFWNAYSTLNAK